MQATETALAELAELKGLATTQQLVSAVRVPFGASLAQLLLHNPFGNAIRHNLPGGRLRIHLTPQAPWLGNIAPPSELSGCFKQGNAALSSIGIGLAIVKCIGELHGHRASYPYAEGWHRVRVDWGGLMARIAGRGKPRPYPVRHPLASPASAKFHSLPNIPIKFPQNQAALLQTRTG